MRANCTKYAKFLLDIGEGRLKYQGSSEKIQVPKEMLMNVDIIDMISFIFCNANGMLDSTTFLENAPKNQIRIYE